jgi:hypothetical protein
VSAVTRASRSIGNGLKLIHPGVSPDKMWFNGAIFDESDAVGDWSSITGTYPFVVKWTLETPMQNFQCSFPSGVRNLGSEDLDGRSREEIWHSLGLKNPDLGEFGHYRKLAGTIQLHLNSAQILTGDRFHLK